MPITAAGRHRLGAQDDLVVGTPIENRSRVEIEELIFGTRSSVVLDPGEERIKSEFDGVKRSFLPMHSVLRIDEVTKRGTSKITQLEGNVTQFPTPLYTSPAGDAGRKT